MIDLYTPILFKQECDTNLVLNILLFSLVSAERSSEQQAAVHRLKSYLWSNDYPKLIFIVRIILLLSQHLIFSRRGGTRSSFP